MTGGGLTAEVGTLSAVLWKSAVESSSCVTRRSASRSERTAQMQSSLLVHWPKLPSLPLKSSREVLPSV